MILSYKWLQEYFTQTLPKPEQLVDSISLRAFEIESIEPNGDDYKIDLKVLPDRAHDCLCHDGIAKEISAITGIEMKKREVQAVAGDFENGIALNVSSDLCRRYISREIRNVVVTESPKELREKLESIGQRSINTIVDITNIVMYTVGQPMHAFDSDKLDGKKIEARLSRAGEKLTTLDNKEVVFDDATLVIADGTEPLAIAGIKGGKKAEVNSATKNIVLESANFHPTDNRKTSQKVGIKTDSSKRYENEISPEIADRAMDMATELILKYASGADTTVSKKTDHYPRKWRRYNTGVSLAEIENLLGAKYSEAQVSKIFDSLKFGYEFVDVHERVVATANNLIGKPYKYGASVFFDAPNAFDCSSFVAYVFAVVGMSIPRMAIDQFVYSDRISEADLVAGDLIFANTLDEKRKIDYKSIEFVKGTEVPHGVDHVGIYLGDGRVVHATEWKNSGVIVEDLKSSVRFQNVVGYGRMAKIGEKRFAVMSPVERLDIRTAPDLIREVGRIAGYENIKEQPVADFAFTAGKNKSYLLSIAIKNTLAELGFSEIMTYTIVAEGEWELKNPISDDRRAVRQNIISNINSSLEKNLRNADLLGLDQIKIFEIGKVFNLKGEKNVLGLGIELKKPSKKIKTGAMLQEVIQRISEKIGAEISVKIADDVQSVEIDLDPIAEKYDGFVYEKLIAMNGDGKYKIISPYPFIVRDIAVWVPDSVSEAEVFSVISENAGALMVRNGLFDVYKKDGRTSYAFRIVFQSMEKTLTDDEANAIMVRVSDEMKGRGWEVR